MCHPMLLRSVCRLKVQLLLQTHSVNCCGRLWLMCKMYKLKSVNVKNKKKNCQCNLKNNVWRIKSLICDVIDSRVGAVSGPGSDPGLSVLCGSDLQAGMSEMK